MVGWVVVLSGNITTLWLHLASWNLQDSQLGCESKMEPSVAIHMKKMPYKLYGESIFGGCYEQTES